jgi:hypothetical protein
MSMSAMVETTVQVITPDAVTREYATKMTTGIEPSPEFARKGLASYAVNVGTKCGHDCTYCSTGAVLRMHRFFKAAGENPFDRGYAIVDPTVPERVAHDARTIKLENRGMVQLCTTTDAWSPEAQEYDLGRKCLEAILSQPGWSVRILTKSAAVAKNYNVIRQHRDRVLVGLSLTAPPNKAQIMRVVEPYASIIPERVRHSCHQQAVGRRQSRAGPRYTHIGCGSKTTRAEGGTNTGDLVSWEVLDRMVHWSAEQAGHARREEGDS